MKRPDADAPGEDVEGSGDQEATPATELQEAQEPVLSAAHRWEMARVQLQAASTHWEKLQAANNLIRAMAPDDLARVALSMDPAERRVVRMTCEFIGAEDTSWSGAQKILAEEKQFKKDVLGMDGDSFMTSRMLNRLDEFGKLNPMEFEDKNTAALALALYLDTCMQIAKEKKGDDGKPESKNFKERRPEWPITVDYAEMPRAVKEAARWGKTALLVCNGHADKVDEIFAAKSCTKIDAKSIMNDTRGIDDVRQGLHDRIVESLLDGRPIQISMSDTAAPFRDMYCADGVLPKSLFNNRSLTHPTEYMKILRYSTENMADIKGVDRLLCYSFVTTDLDLAEARSQLCDALPYFAEMAIVELNPDSVQ